MIVLIDSFNAPLINVRADGGCRHVAAGLFEVDRMLQTRKQWQHVDSPS